MVGETRRARVSRSVRFGVVFPTCREADALGCCCRHRAATTVLTSRARTEPGGSRRGRRATWPTGRGPAPRGGSGRPARRPLIDPAPFGPHIQGGPGPGPGSLGALAATALGPVVAHAGEQRGERDVERLGHRPHAVEPRRERAGL